MHRPGKRHKANNWTKRSKVVHGDIPGCRFFRDVDHHVLTDMMTFLTHEDVVAFGILCHGTNSRVRHLHEYWGAQLRLLGGSTVGCTTPPPSRTAFDTPYKEIFLRKRPKTRGSGTVVWCPCHRNLVRRVDAWTYTPRCSLCTTAPLVRTVQLRGLFSPALQKDDTTGTLRKTLSMFARQILTPTSMETGGVHWMDRFHQKRRDSLMNLMVRLLSLCRTQKHGLYLPSTVRRVAEAFFTLDARIQVSGKRLCLSDPADDPQPPVVVDLDFEPFRKNLGTSLRRVFLDHLQTEDTTIPGTTDGPFDGLLWDIRETAIRILALCMFPVLSMPRVLCTALEAGLDVGSPAGVWPRVLVHIVSQDDPAAARRQLGLVFSDMQFIHVRRASAGKRAWVRDWIQKWQAGRRDSFLHENPETVDAYTRTLFPGGPPCPQGELFPLPAVENYSLDRLYTKIDRAIHVGAAAAEHRVYGACGRILYYLSSSTAAKLGQSLPTYVTSGWFSKVLRSNVDLSLDRSVRVGPDVPGAHTTFLYSCELGKTETMQRLFPQQQGRGRTSFPPGVPLLR